MRQILMAITISTAACGIGFQPAQAGLCADEIARFQTTVKQSEASGDVPSGVESTGAKLSHQPTAESMRVATAAAESNLSDIIAHAKDLDARGNETQCMRLLKDAELRLNPD